jgi:hypothetical protein
LRPSDDALVFTVSLPRPAYAAASHLHEYLERLLHDVDALPGVAAAGAIDYLPVGGMAPSSGFRDATLEVGVWSITPGYLRAMGMSLTAGRHFTDGDVRCGAPVVIVSESVARHFRAGPATGQYLTVDKQPRQVIGVVRDARARYGASPRASVYRPMTTERPGQAIVVRHKSGAAELPALLRRWDSSRGLSYPSRPQSERCCVAVSSSRRSKLRSSSRLACWRSSWPQSVCTDSSPPGQRFEPGK